MEYYSAFKRNGMLIHVTTRHTPGPSTVLCQGSVHSGGAAETPELGPGASGAERCVFSAVGPKAPPRGDPIRGRG